jgi:Uncharacterized conserved protein
MKKVAIAGTFDTKGPEYQYVKNLIESMGCKTLTIHTGVYEPYFKPDVPNDEVAKAAGVSIQEVADRHDRAFATETLSQGMAKLIPELYAQGLFDGILSLGGTGGTSLATPAMQALPIGVPKIMVSTVASGDTSPYVGTSDVIMMPSIVDVAGLNSISTTIFKNAALAIVGMVKMKDELPVENMEKKPLVAATMFGVTTPCVNYAKDYLETRGYEVLVFHATGTGGKTMESLIENGFITGVLDLTTTEWCDELFGGVLNAGPNRCEAAAKNGVPAVMSVGALDMVNFGPYDTVPAHYAHRNLYKHNPTVTLMRTTVDENEELGRKLAHKLNMSVGKAALFLPLKGVSMIDAEGQPFYGPEEDKKLFDTLRQNVNPKIVDIVEMDNLINDQVFAEAAAQKLIDFMEG